MIHWPSLLLGLLLGLMVGMGLTSAALDLQYGLSQRYALPEWLR